MVNLIVLILALFLYRIYVINQMLDKFNEISDPEVHFKSFAEFWKMVFSFKRPIIENFISASDYYKLIGSLSNVFKVRTLKKAKKAYIKDIKTGDNFGLCVKIMNALHSQGFEEWIIPNLDLYITGFTADFLGGNDKGLYWWPITDTKSRIAALDKLIKLYS